MPKKKTKVGEHWELQRIFVEFADAERMGRARAQRSQRQTAAYAEDELSD